MTAEEKAFRDKIDRVELEELMYDEFYELIAEAIKIGKEKGQEEAYNQAIDDAAKKAKVSLFDWINGGFKEFKQNSNHYSINDGTYVKIDEQSILKLKK